MNTHLLMYADAQDRARRTTTGSTGWGAPVSRSRRTQRVGRGRVWIQALGAPFGGDRRGPVPAEIAVTSPATLRTTVAWI
jgi:hypothetical protein